MITAVDTNVLADILLPGREHREASHGALLRCRREGPLIVSEVVVAELSTLVPGDGTEAILRQARLTFVPLGLNAAIEAGLRWSQVHRQADRARIVADFLIGAHAVENANRLLTRDRGFYRKVFSGLTVIAP